MAKILYGVAGEGMGHAVRSRVLIGHLSKRHKVKVVAASKAFRYLSKYFDVEEIDYFKIIYRNNRTANTLTFFNNIFRFPIIFFKSLRILRIIRNFKPDVVITDFEPLVDYYAFFKRIPVISIDNQHILTKTNLGIVAEGYGFTKFIMKALVKLFIIKSNKYFVNTFYDVKGNNKNVEIIKPLLRKVIFETKPIKGNHILVYQTSQSNKKLISELQKIKEKFIVYGFSKNKKIDNVILKKNSEEGFLEDLRVCKALITNGGFTLMSEALFLRKPVLSIPVEKHFEQILNALLLEKTGCGIFAKETSEEVIRDFLKKMPKLQTNLKKYRQYNNNEAFEKIDEAIKSLS